MKLFGWTFYNPFKWHVIQYGNEFYGRKLGKYNNWMYLHKLGGVFPYKDKGLSFESYEGVAAITKALNELLKTKPKKLKEIVIHAN
jgi:hypothetical protein